MSGGGQKTKSVSQNLVNPFTSSALYGTNVTPIYNKKGALTNSAEVFAAMEQAKQNNSGLLNRGETLSQQPALNQTQQSALTGITNYLTSPESLAGQQAMQQVASNFLGQLGNANTSTPAQVGSGAPVDWNAIRNSYQSDLSRFNAPTVAAPQTSAAPTVSAGSVGGLGINYRDAMDRALSGEVNNPYLQEMAKNAGDLATQNWQRTVLPALSSGARQSGMYGSSRQGVAQGIAAGDLNRAITDANTNLFGNAYESAQGRAANAASQLAGYDMQAQMANAQMQQAAALANAQMAQSNNQFNAGLSQQANLANASNALQALGLSSQYDLGRQGLGLQEAGQRANYDIGLRGLGLDAGRLDLSNRALTSQNAIAGAGLANQAAQIPLGNLNALLGVGNTIQQAPWQQLGNYADLLYPTNTLGGAQTQRSETSQQLGSGQILGGIAALGLGAMTGGAGLGALGGLLGGLGGAAVVPGANGTSPFGPYNNASGGYLNPTPYNWINPGSY